MNRLTEAKAECSKAPADDPFRMTGEAILAARSRDIAELEGIIEHMRERFGAAASFQYAQIYAQAATPIAPWPNSTMRFA